MPVFCIGETDYEFKESDTLLDVKKSLIQSLELSSTYIDIVIDLKKPMRTIGKFNLEPGRMSRTLDRYPLDRFAFKEKLPITVQEVSDYDPTPVRKPLFSGGRGRGRGSGLNRPQINRPQINHPQINRPHSILQNSLSSFDSSQTRVEMTVEPNFDLTSQDEFPSLGSSST